MIGDSWSIKFTLLSGTLLYTFRPAVDSLRSSPTVQSTPSKLLECFSIQTSLKALTDTSTKPGQILCLNGIRVLSINWIVITHCYLFVMELAADRIYLVSTFFHRPSSSIIVNGFPAVDTFFTLSGFLVTYLLLKQLGKSGMSAMHWFAYYFHRYVRLTPPYALVILVEVCSKRWFLIMLLFNCLLIVLSSKWLRFDGNIDPMVFHSRRWHDRKYCFNFWPSFSYWQDFLYRKPFIQFRYGWKLNCNYTT